MKFGKLRKIINALKNPKHNRKILLFIENFLCEIYAGTIENNMYDDYYVYKYYFNSDKDILNVKLKGKERKNDE